MFSTRRVLSLGFRMTLKHLQDNITSMQTLRYRTLVIPRFNFSLSRRNLTEASPKPPIENEKHSEEVNKQKVLPIEGKLKLGFTCKKCNTRNFKEISKQAYTTGVVIVRCDGCKSNHLIADNLGWFEGNGSRNIETIMKQKGESVRRIRENEEGYLEVVAHEEALRIQRLMKEEDENSVKLGEEAEDVVKVKYEKVGQSTDN